MKKLFVFDLDFTIWDAGGTWCDCTIPPYKYKNGEVFDSEGAKIKLYPDAVKIFETLKQNGYKIAIASRTNAPKSAKQLMKLLDIEKYIDHSEIYPKQKTFHFESLAKKTKIPHHEMVFFDDEIRNIIDVRGIGVDCVLVENGINEELVYNYLQNTPTLLH
ncbi:MAG: magnesium-dependent phosphatase-1 [Marinilabiliaceae bacterium]|nr:magnesium-dependent phosphatase-1 [Marinilabiliaceae bacterium]